MEIKNAMNPNRLLTIAGFLILVSLNLSAGDIRIIANPSVKADTISARDLKSVFLLQRKTLPDGSPVLPVLQKSGQIHEAFLKRHLDRGSEELQTYYQGLVFTGKGSMPKQVTSDAEAVASVAQTRGGIGYVSASAATPGVKILLVDTGAPSQERTLVKRVEPEYPQTLRQMGIGGSVRLLITVSPSGAVKNVEILGGNPILAEAAMDAVKRWVYVPAPSKTELQVTIPFEPRR
jgi:TonB family protein